jgi:hypothetical protein
LDTKRHNIGVQDITIALKLVYAAARTVMPLSYVLLEEANSADDAPYNGTRCSYEWRSLNAPTLKGFLLKIFVFITKTPLWGPLFTLFAARSGLFKVNCRLTLAASRQDLFTPLSADASTYARCLLQLHCAHDWYLLPRDDVNPCAGFAADVCSRTGDLQAASGSEIL